MIKIFILLCLSFLFPSSAYSQTLIEEYLCELGIKYFEMEKYDEALSEFNKVIILNPNNETAKEYINRIFAVTRKEPKEKITTQALDEIQKPNLEVFQEVKKPLKEKGWKLKGVSQLSLGFTSQDIIWKRANFDLNEENWRILSDKAYNLKENTYDPAIFQQIKFDLDYSGENLGFHTKIDISPWSFIGKSNKVSLISDWGDTAEIELKYWSNTRYTINETIYTTRLGNSFNLPEIKVVDGQTHFVRIRTVGWGPEWWNYDHFNIPPLKIHRKFQPLRELWFDYNQNNLKLRFFPLALQDLSFTSDDPLMLSNRKSFWEPSPWLYSWRPGHINRGVIPQDFYKGKWDRSLAFFTRDSEGVRLTNLRGFSLNFDDGNKKIDFTFASPKNLWQDYDSFDTFQGSLRPKFLWLDNFTIGGLYNFKLGLNEKKLDASNQVWSLDLNYGITPYTQIFFQTARSNSQYDKTSAYESKKRGNAFHLSLINSSIDVFGKNYFQINPLKDEPFYKLRLSFTHMDRGFESALSNYKETRDDCFWSRHIHFRPPFRDYLSGLYEPGLTWDDVKIYRIGDGVDYGRDVINLRAEFENFLEKRLDTLFDVRNVHHTNGKFIENVMRLETTYKLTPKLTTKFLGIYHALPKTKAGYDPFIFDPISGEYYRNASIEGGKDPSLKTLSLGGKYDFFDWLNLSFIFERTNDTTLAYDNFPRGLLSWTSFTTYNEYGKRYRKELFGLYHTDKFPLPPYPYFDIFKLGLGIKPLENLNIYLNFTHNEYDWAQLIDDNTNQIGLEVSYNFLENLGLYLRYAYSRVKDISELAEKAKVQKNSHHYLFSELRYRLTKDSEFVSQYGVGTTAFVGTSLHTPFGGNLPVLDTQHILRLYYRHKF